MKSDDIANTVVTILYVVILAFYVKRLFTRTTYGGRVRKPANIWRWRRASKAFGIGLKKLKKMSKNEIKKLYRKKAMKTHPDHGGNAEDFNKLHEAYMFTYNAAHA